MTRRSWTRSLSVVLAVALTGILPACSKSSSPSTPSRQRRIIISGNWTIGALDLGFAPFTTSATGDLEAIVNFTFTSSDIEIAILRGTCTNQLFIAGQCNLSQSNIVAETNSNAKPERISISALAAGNYTLVIVNFNDFTGESGTYEVALTS